MLTNKMIDFILRVTSIAICVNFVYETISNSNTVTWYCIKKLLSDPNSHPRFSFNTNLLMALLYTGIFGENTYYKCAEIVTNTNYILRRSDNPNAKYEDLVFYDRDYYGRNVFYYIENCEYMETWQKNSLKNMIVNKFTNYNKVHILCYRNFRKFKN